MIRVQNVAFQFKLKSTKVDSRRVINNICCFNAKDIKAIIIFI